MPISVRYRNESNQECILRPTPLVSIVSAINKVGGETVGVTYTITLTGKILDDMGAPYARSAVNDAFFYVYHEGAWKSFSSAGKDTNSFVGPYNAFDPTVSHEGQKGPLKQRVGDKYKLDSIFFKQKVIRSLFAIDGQRMEIIPVHGDQPY